MAKDPIKIRDELKARCEAEIYKRALRNLKTANAKYDAVDPNNEGKRKAKQPETQEEEQILRQYDRNKGITLTRDLERNLTNAKSIIRQFKVNVAGWQGGKVRFATSDKEWNKTASKWFNSVWSKDCDSRDDNHFNDFLQLIVATVKREGDTVGVFDDFDRDDGKLIFYEGDQLATVNESEWKLQTDWTENVTLNGKKVKVPLKQESGVIHDSKGRTVAYCVTSKRGCESVSLKEATIIPKTSARLIMAPWRLNQKRGVGDLLTASADMQDIYEMRSKELQSAKLAATFAGTVEGADAIEKAIIRGGVAPESLLETADGTAAVTSEKKHYDALEALTGGIMEYMGKGEAFKMLDFNRPNVNIKDFFEFVQSSAGQGMGLAECYVKLRASTAYTAFRGEMLMSWGTFTCDQKWLERRWLDWICKKVIGWAVRKKLLKAPPDGWESGIAWRWPKMPQVDPLKDTDATNGEIKNGYTDFSEILGPDWEERIIELGRQLEIVRAAGIPLSAFETKAGAPTTYPSQNTDQQGATQ